MAKLIFSLLIPVKYDLLHCVPNSFVQFDVAKPKEINGQKTWGKKGKDCIRLDTFIKVKTFQDNANIEFFFEAQPETAVKTSIYLLWNCMARPLTMFECY